MSDALNLIKQLAGLPQATTEAEVEAPVNEMYKENLSMYIGRLFTNAQDLREIAEGGKGSAQGVIQNMRNLLDVIEQGFQGK